MWYKSLDPSLAGVDSGYKVVDSLYYYYPSGCVNAVEFSSWSNVTNYKVGNIVTYEGVAYTCKKDTIATVPGTDDSIWGFMNQAYVLDDSVDVFNGGLSTTIRAQLQWRLNIQRVSLQYGLSSTLPGGFARLGFGLECDPTVTATDPSTGIVLNGVYAQGKLATVTPGVSPLAGDDTYKFVNMGSINGDTGVWRAGDGNVDNSLGSMDGYAYAMPVAVVFQRNKGVFTTDLANPFGCANPTTPLSGVIKYGRSNRFDKKLADSVWEEDVVDTRHMVSLNGYIPDKLVSEGFIDLVTGATRQKVARGETPGNKQEALGSSLSYTLAVSPSAIPNCDSGIGQNFDGVVNDDQSWHGFRNGFSSDERVFYTTQKITTDQKSTGITSSAKGSVRWTKNDTFVVSLPIDSPASISYVGIQCLVNNKKTGGLTPIQLMEGQVSISYDANKKHATVRFLYDLINTPYDPGQNPLYVTIGVKYPAGGKLDLRVVPTKVYGGLLQDRAIGKFLPVYGVSEYDVSADQSASDAKRLVAYNSGFSDTVFGTRAWIEIPASSGVQVGAAGSSPATTFFVPSAKVEGELSGLYVVHCYDADTNEEKHISSRSIVPATSGQGQMVFTISDSLNNVTTLRLEVLCANTAQLVYNAPVRGVTAIEETILFGNSRNSGFAMDNRLELLTPIVMDTTVSPPQNVIVIAANECTLKGIAGNDNSTPIIWVQDSTGAYTQVLIDSVTISNGLATIRVSNKVNLTSIDFQKFFFIGAILPAFHPHSTLLISELYTPYQGEGIPGRDYEVVHTEDTALITTNGTGEAPLVGLHDVFPLNRELPIATTLPAQANWNHAELTNQAVSSFFDCNYDAKQFNNVEHTFEAPLRTADFIQPISGGKRKCLQFLNVSSGKGFAKTVPHIGYAIRPLTQRTVLGDSIVATSTPVTLYVNNEQGSDLNDGLSINTPVKTIKRAINSLPPVLRHPCSLQLVPTGRAYSLGIDDMETIALGDGDIRSIKYYALANIGFTIQAAGRLVISTLSTAADKVVIDATGFVGDGTPAYGFFVDNTRVLFNRLSFTGFLGTATTVIKGLDSDIEFIDCDFTSNLVAGSFEQGCMVTMDGGSLTLDNAGTGMILASSDMMVSNVDLAVKSDAKPNVFFVAEINSTIEFQKHDPSKETGVQAGTVVALAQTSSSLVCESNFSSGGKAMLQMNSSLSRTVALEPYAGGVTSDASSSIVTSLS
jgi:hypothetical protein